ncbi:MAG: SAM-dependent methyltransferase [Desulfovibrio sp.]|nr:SAM-dependent methyltransferase [Desulfovibrio sp.]
MTPLYGIEKKALPRLLRAANMLLHSVENPLILHGNSLEMDLDD